MIEQQILQNLIFNEEFSRRTLPFLTPEYFQDRVQRNIYGLIDAYIKKYNKVPSKSALIIDAENASGVTDEEVKSIVDQVSSMTSVDLPDIDWLIDQTEKFCQDKAIYNAIMNSIQILDGRDTKVEKGAIPQLLSDALGVSFDNNIGHDFLENVDERYDYYHKQENRIPFDLDYFNKITKGGLPPKTLNVALAGCVHPDTPVRVKTRALGTQHWLQTEVPIKEIERLFDTQHEVLVDSPDGFVPVSLFIDKGEWDEYRLDLCDGRTVSVNENHLFQTLDGWKYAKDMAESNSPPYLLFTDDGYIAGNVSKTGKTIPIVDIQVEHDNHRYYTNGVSSHNTNVGKSLLMCHMAAANLIRGYNVLYITLELAEERVAERIDANLTNTTMEDLADLTLETYKKKLERVKHKTTGKLIIKEYPSASAHAGHFRHLLNELKLKKNFRPDIIYIDYINICASSRLKMGGSVNSYGYIKAIAEEIRGLAQEFNVPIFTATQATRSGHSNSDIALEDTSECIAVDQDVTLVSGETKQIGDVKIGDQITSADDFNTTMVVHHKKIKPCVKITTASGKTIVVSRDHVFPTLTEGNIARLSVNTGLKVGSKLSTQ